MVSRLFFLALAVLALASAASAQIGGYGRPHYDDGPARPYSYHYAVSDSYSGANFNAKEDSDGKNVNGAYQVHLPDGRVQTVTYTADHYNGYIADVKYDGQPQFPKHQPSRPYKAAPPSYGRPHSFF